MKDMKCPHCNVDLETSEVYGGTFDQHYEEERFGYCPECEKNFRWVHVFVYESTKDFEEV